MPPIDAAPASVAPLPADAAGLLALAAPVHAPVPAEGLFRDGSWLRRVAAEPSLLFGGGRALLLEVAHPLVAAGVAEHSNFREDPFGRLQRTLEAMNSIAFRDLDTALAAARGVEASHRRVRGRLVAAAGPFPAGTPYSGRDPELVRWVWATLVDTSRVVYERFVAPLEAAALAEWYADQCVMGRLLGVPPELVPADAGAFRAWFDGVLESDTLTVTATAREIADAVLRFATGPVKALTAGLLPARLREAFGLAWDERRAARVDELAASVRALRRPPGRLDASGASR